MKSVLVKVRSGDTEYNALKFICPGCAAGKPEGDTGLHMLPVNNRDHDPSWNWDGNEEAPTLEPSILTEGETRCHSYLKAGVFEFLSDSTHPLAGQHVPMPDLPEWAIS